MERFDVQLSAEAEQNIRDAYEFIKNRGPADPDQWKTGLYEKLESLETIPTACGFAPENDYREAPLRQAFYGPFRLIFEIRENQVFVLSVRHGARLSLTPDELDQID
jgi:plasmid stabilization system protein ParE